MSSKSHSRHFPSIHDKGDPSTVDADLPVVRGESVFWSGFSFIILGLALLLLATAAVFFLSVHKKEVVIVPQVTKLPLVDALIELQEKYLVPKVLLKISNESGDAGTILYQSPASGAKVVIGRKITLTVSRGNLVDKVPNYVGEPLYRIQNDANRLQYISSSLLIGQVHYVKRSNTKNGLIVAQKPQAGSPLSTPIVLELWVSGTAATGKEFPAEEDRNTQVRN